MRKHKVLGTLLISWNILVLLWIGSVCLGQDAPKKHPAKFEEAVYRATLKARNVDSQHVIQLTVVPNDILDEDNFVVVAEFQSGDIGIYQGYLDKADDQWVYIGKRELKMLEEAAHRCR